MAGHMTEEPLNVCSVNCAPTAALQLQNIAQHGHYYRKGLGIATMTMLALLAAKREPLHASDGSMLYKKGCLGNRVQP